MMGFLFICAIIFFIISMGLVVKGDEINSKYMFVLFWISLVGCFIVAELS
jgi:ABC-type transport system involved in multi-copper enzyme maturation permease subunit